MMVNLSLLGSFQANINGQPMQSFKAQKAKALLIFLAVEARHTYQRESLMTMLWPDFSLKSAQQNLRQTLYLLRQSLPIEHAPEFFRVDRFTVTWNPDVPLSLDITQFEDLANSLKPADWHQATSLYRGHFIEDFYLPDSEPFEEWVANKRAYLFNVAQEVMAKLSSHYIAKGSWQPAEEINRRLLEIDKLQEPAHRQLIEILARSGRRQDALRQYNTLRQLLRNELDLEPDTETVSLIDAIREGSLGPASASKHTPVQLIQKPLKRAALNQPYHNLPQSLAKFIGRRQEISEIQALISDHRLVMLTGAAGIGKTNLCLMVGRGLTDSFPDGVWMVELAPVKDPIFIPQAIASAMGLGEVEGRPMEKVLLDVLRDNRCLLILDNCEYLIDDAARYAEVILQSAAGVRILASSLEPFKIPGELQYHVPPLSIPGDNTFPNLEDWQKYDAIRLFVARAQAVLPDFQITEKNISSVVQICHQLDGNPLAIELAAARINVLSAANIAARLDDRFNLLVSGSRTALPRHQTLRSMMEWSWELLSRAEKDLLQRLSIFAGGMTLQAVETVCDGDGIETHEVLDLITQLVNKSLVIAKRQPGHEIRYHLLETIRQYGLEQLEHAGDLTHYRDRHLAYFNHLADEAEPKLVGPDQAVWMEKLRGEMDNLRLALSWAQETNIKAGIKLFIGIWRFLAYGNLVEAQTWFKQLLSQTDNTFPRDLMAKALWVQSRIWTKEEEIRIFARQSLSIYQDLDDQEGIANCLGVIGESFTYTAPNKYKSLLHQSEEIFRSIGNKLGLGEVLFWQGRLEEDEGFEQANAIYQESLALFREIGHLVGIANVLVNTAHFSTFHEKYQTAGSLVDECLAIQNELGYQGLANTFAVLGHLYLHTKEYQSALETLERSISLGKRNGEKELCDWVTAYLGYVYLRMGDLEQALQSFMTVIPNFLDLNIVIGVVYAVEGLASRSVALKQPDKGARLFGWAEKTRVEINNSRRPAEVKYVEKDRSTIIKMIGKDAYNTAYAEGQLLSIEQAVSLASELSR